jgi:DNA polymerase-3 subunit delta
MLARQTHSVAQVYLFYGTEEFLIEEEIDSVIRRVNPVMPDMNVTFYRYEETPVQDAIREAYTLPFMAERRVIVFRGMESLTSVRGSCKVDHDLASLERYLVHPAESTVFIVTVPGEKLDERKKLTQLFRNHANVRAFNGLKPQEAVPWIQKKAQAMGIRIHPDAALHLYHAVAGHLRIAVSELEKIALYTGEGTMVTTETLEPLVVRLPEGNVFHFVDCVMRRKWTQASQLLEDLLALREPPLKLTALLARQCRLVWFCLAPSNRGRSMQDIAQRLGVHPYAARMAAEQAKGFTIRQLERMIRELAEMDYAVKSGQTGDAAALRTWMLRQAAGVEWAGDRSMNGNETGGVG